VGFYFRTGNALRRLIMNRIILLIVFVALPFSGRAADTCALYNQLNTAIRDQTIPKKEAQKQARLLLAAIARNFMEQEKGIAFPMTKVFPLEGYTYKAIGGKNGSGYISAGYDFFSGNKHAGHPAHDIFIYDKNQDGLDDRTGKPVNVLSYSFGIVVATETNWQSGSDQRGGNYIWIYSLTDDALYYYAHNNKVLVHPGQIVNPGDTIATVGRTGKNASQKRSPTHLHFMMLKLDKNDYPRPENCYDYLRMAGK